MANPIFPSAVGLSVFRPFGRSTVTATTLHPAFSARLTSCCVIGFSLFYLIPIVLVSWFAGSPLGSTIATASALMWYLADSVAGAKYSSHWIPVWNSFIRLTFFLITVFSAKEAKELDREREVFPALIPQAL